MSRRVPPVWRPTPADPDDLFAADDLERARRYQRPLRRMRTLRLVGGLAITVGFVVLQVGPRLVDGLGLDRWVAQLLVVFAALELARLVVDLPIDAWVDLRHDRRWGLSNQTGRGLAADEAKSVLLSFALGAVLLVPVYALVRSTTWWWLWAWLLVVGFSIVAGLLFPVVISPLFNRFEPLGEGDLLDRVRRVAALAGVEVARVEVADESRRSTRDNAYVAGLGPTRRVVLYDTLLDTPPELVEQVVAHELGHVRRHHLRRQLPVLAVVSFVVLAVLGGLSRWTGLFEAFGLDGPGDPAGLPLAVLAVEAAGAVVGPVTAWVSRAFEREADLEALDLLGRPDLVEAMLRRLHVNNLADLDPGPVARLTMGHPPAAERIAFARAWAAPGLGDGPGAQAER
jgi:STE24 endopeptidase